MNIDDFFSGVVKVQAAAKRARIDHRRLGGIKSGRIVPTSLELTRLAVLFSVPFDIIWTRCRQQQEHQAKANSKRVKDA